MIVLPDPEKTKEERRRERLTYGFHKFRIRRDLMVIHTDIADLIAGFVPSGASFGIGVDDSCQPAVKM